MTRKQIPTSRRAAIWRAHNRRCIYCTELITFSDLDVDHIVPDHLFDKESDLEPIVQSYNLPGNFEANGLTNLVPSHRHCNLQKLGQVLPKSRTLHFLSIAEAKAAKAEQIEAEIKRQIERDNITGLLQVALDKGLLSVGQMNILLSAYSKDHDIFEVLASLPFGDVKLKGYFSSSDVDLLYEKPILPRPHGLEQLEMTREVAGETEKISVASCREWAEAVRDGYFALTTYDIKEESLFRKVYAVVACLAQAKVPKPSYISNPRLGASNLELLPLRVLPILSRDDEEEITTMETQGISMTDLEQSGRVQVVECSALSLHLHFDGMGLVLSEIMCADIDGDGVEDILVGSYEYALGGTYGVGPALLLTRRGPDTPFTFVQDVQLTPEKEA
jgi:hypothetical protein